jgi:hypothetical protein
MNIWQAISYIAARTNWSVEELTDANQITVAAVSNAVVAIEAHGDENVRGAYLIYRDWKQSRFAASLQAVGK